MEYILDHASFHKVSANLTSTWLDCTKSKFVRLKHKTSIHLSYVKMSIVKIFSI